MARDVASSDLRSTAQGNARACSIGLLCALAWPLAIASAHARSLEVRVEQSSGKPLVGAVVMLRALEPGRASAPAVDAVMDQIDRRFVPDVVVVPVGSRVTFPNSDPISHQVYSFSPIRRFQLPLYRGKPYPPVEFRQAGIATLGCNIHDEMRAYIVVSDGQHFGRTESDGVWRATQVLPGSYTLNVWHPRLREPQGLIERRVDVIDKGDVQTIVVRAATALRPAPRAAKPASWDAY